MKRTISICIICITILFSFSCRNRSAEHEHLGVLTMHFVLMDGTRTIMPVIDLSIESYSIFGSGPDGNEFSYSTTSSSYTVEELLLGSWDITVLGFNSIGEVVADGYSSIVIEPGIENVIELSLAPVSGIGSFAGTISWTEGFIDDPQAEATLTNNENAEFFPSITYGANSAVIEHPTLATGYYIFDFVIQDGSRVLYGGTEAVLILNQTLSNFSLDLNLPSGLRQGDLSFSIIADLNEPLDVSILSDRAIVFRGDQLSLNAHLKEEISDAHFSWYINGSFYHDAADILVDTNDLPSFFRVDAVGSTAGMEQSGSDSLIIELIEPHMHGSYLFVHSLFDSDDEVDGLSGARCIETVSDSNTVLVAGYDEDSISLFSINDTDFSAEHISCFKGSDWDGLDGVTALEVSPDGDRLYTVSVKDNALNIYELNIVTGSIALLSSFKHGAPDISSLLGASDIELSHDQRFIYVAGSGDHSITVFEYFEATQEYSLSDVFYPGADIVDSFISPQKLELDHSGEFLYVTCWDGDSLFILRRNIVNGSLSYEYSFSDGVDIDCLNGATAVAESSDGNHLYVAAYYDNAIAHFVRSSVSGSYTFKRAYENNSDGIQNMHYPREIYISPEGDELYVAASGSDAITFLFRDINSGGLTYSSSAVNGDGRVSGLDGVRDITMNNQGSCLLAVSSNDNALSVFRKNN